MTVYRQTFRAWEGERTTERTRFGVVSRYGLERVFRSRVTWIYFVLSLMPPLAAGALICVRSSPDLMPGLRTLIDGFITVDPQFFAVLMGIQSTLGFFLAALTGPGLISPDLVNGALPLYLSRPLSRTDYVLGKLLVLGLLLSALTWAPGLLLYLLQSMMAGNGWFQNNGRIAMAVVVGGTMWTLTIALLALAISAWVRWRAVAAAVLFGVFFVGAGFGALVNELMNTDWGAVLDLSGVITAIWQSLFLGTVFEVDYPLPIWTAWSTLVIVWTISTVLLSVRLRGSEISR